MKRLILLTPLVLALLIGITASHAQRSDDPAALQSDYYLSWYTIDSGGATVSTGGSFSLSGSMGQPDAGTLSGGSYTLTGSLWGASAISHNIYLPLVVKHP